MEDGRGRGLLNKIYFLKNDLPSVFLVYAHCQAGIPGDQGSKPSAIKLGIDFIFSKRVRGSPSAWAMARYLEYARDYWIG